MKTAQAKKIAAAAGLECKWFAIGGFWRAYNKITGQYVVFDSAWLRSYGDRDFQKMVAEIA